MRVLAGLAISLRNLCGRPSLTLLATTTLALGIGVTTAMFSVVDTLLIRPLPFPGAERLVEIRGTRADGIGSSRFPIAALQELRDEHRVFSAVEGYQFAGVTLTGVSDPVDLTSPQITPGLLRMLGVTPILGRLLKEGDAAGTSPAAVIGETLWRGTFGGDPGVIGRPLVLDDIPHTIVGVLPASFMFPMAHAAVWRPMRPASQPDAYRGGTGAMVTVALLQPQVTREMADDRLAALTEEFHAAGYMPVDRTLVTADPVQRTATAARVQNALGTMLGATGLVLLLAWINVANLLLVRGLAREGELAVRVALGSSRAGAAGWMVAEGLVLGLIGGAGGILLAKAMLAGMVAILPPQMTELAGVTAAVDTRVLAFAVVMSFITCMAINLLPAWRAARIDLVAVMNRRLAGGAGGRDDRLQALLLSGQIAAVMVILTAAALLTVSFARLVSVDPGFEARDLTVATVQASGPARRDAGRLLQLTTAIAHRIEAAFPSALVALSDGVPPGGNLDFNAAAQIAGRESMTLPASDWIYSHVTGSYFRAMRIPVLEGRPFDDNETEPVMMVNDVMARRFWGGRSPIGDRFRLRESEPWRTIVGVTRDVKQAGLADEYAAGAEFYLPYEPHASFGVIARSPEPDVASRMMATIRGVDPDLPLRIESMEQRLAVDLWQSRFFTRLAVAFAAIAVVIAAIGVYGAAAHWVDSRRREMAVRSAVGATRGNIVRLVLHRGLMATAAGTVAGILVSLGASHLIQAMLFETEPADPLALGGAALLVALLVLAGSIVPATHAAATDPASILRGE